ncbi:hypothetical protein F8M41_002111 [Gigaspora margarita]|uniref:Uncharacterized protein n=1 Tax=Gigaspora margarita TaxID=4874 RepID=A0A8H3XDB8_GIGMA|nr:hypothetical protein F8M41_002111 [Gigaspora margarita]
MHDTDFSLLLQFQNDDLMKGMHDADFSLLLQSQNDDLMKAKVLPIENILWAIYKIFFEDPYRHLKRLLEVRTDLLVMTQATSLVHCYQLGDICVLRDKDYLWKWVTDNLSSAYTRAFFATTPEVKDIINALKLLFGDNKPNKTQSDVDSSNNRLYLNLMIENLKKFQRRGKKKESQINLKGETQQKPMIF